jgi:hypothetical protein
MRKSEHHRSLVKRLTNGVVDGSPEKRRGARSLDAKKARVAAGNHKSKRRTRNFRRRNGCVRSFIRAVLAEETREQVRRNVINRVKRPIQRERDRLCETGADEQTSDESRPNSRSDGVDFLDRDTRIIKCRTNDWKNALDMRAARDLRHDTAILRVKFVLRRDHARADAETLIDHRGGGLIARTFDTKDARHARAW